MGILLLGLFIEHGFERELFTYGPVLVLASIGLLQRIWPAWLFLVVVHVGSLVVATFIWAALLNAIMAILLVAPPTRRYARRGRPRLSRAG